MNVQIYTTAHNGQDYRLEGNDLQAFASYGTEGSGFGYLSFKLTLRVGFDYACLGYAYRCRVYKGPWRCLFDGQIARITERTGASDEIEVWCLGWVHVATAEVFNRVYLDTRYPQWLLNETPNGHFQPQKFCIDTQDHLYFKPRRGETENGDFVTGGDYTAARYVFPFGEHAARFVANYTLALPASFPAKAQVLAGETLLWESGISGAGTIDLTAPNGAMYFEIRFVTTATGNVSAEDDSVYARFEAVRVYSLNVTILDQKCIADEIVSVLARHGLSDDRRRVQSPGFALSQATFDTDQPPADILTWLCQFGDREGKPVAWGVSFDDRRLAFLESYALTGVKYVVRPEEAESLERAGDWGESAQQVYGIYTDTQGRQRRTAELQAALMTANLGGYYRRKAINLNEIPSEGLALSLLTTWLSENSAPKASGSYVVRGARTAEGRRVPFDEIQPGGLVQVQEFRALEVESGRDDYRDKVTTFMLVGARVDYEQGTVELMPDETSDVFQRQMAVVAHLLGE